MIKRATTGSLRDERIGVDRTAGPIEHYVAGSSNDHNEKQTNDETDHGVASPLILGQCCIHSASVKGGRVMVGPSLIQHLAVGEVSRHEVSTDMIAAEKKGICVGQRYRYSPDSSWVSK